MINEVANELGVDPESAVMTDVLTAVQSIAKEEDLISAEVKAARKISAWWRHTNKRRNGEVPAHEKFPPRDPSGAGVLNSVTSLFFTPQGMARLKGLLARPPELFAVAGGGGGGAAGSRSAEEARQHWRGLMQWEGGALRELLTAVALGRVP